MKSLQQTLESLIEQRQRCRGGDSVCSYQCKRCARYRDWCYRNSKAVLR